MSRTNNEPEYRWRIRDKTEKYNRNAEEKRQKAAEDAKNYEVIRSIYTIIREYYRHNNEERSRKDGDRFWEIAGVVGLWAAAAVGALAIWIGTHDASDQREQLKAQAEIMHNTLIMSERPWLYVSGDIGFGAINRTPGNKIQNVTVAVNVINKGNSIAIDVGGGGQLITRQFNLDNRFSKIDINNIPCSDRFEGAMPPAEFERDKFAVPPQEQQRLSFHAGVEGLNVSRRAAPYFAECIQYKWPLKGETFHTWFLIGISFFDEKTQMPSYEIPDRIREIRPNGPINYIDAR